MSYAYSIPFLSTFHPYIVTVFHSNLDNYGSLQVVFGDIDPTVGAATEKEFVKKYGRDKVRYVVLDVTDGSKFEGKHTNLESKQTLKTT